MSVLFLCGQGAGGRVHTNTHTHTHIYTRTHAYTRGGQCPTLVFSVIHNSYVEKLQYAPVPAGGLGTNIIDQAIMTMSVQVAGIER